MNTTNSTLALFAACIAACIAAGCAHSPMPDARATAAFAAPANPSAHPVVAGIVAEISPARIEARVRRLVAFGTRHTLSDTVSDTRGIGAARRWIERELQACSVASGGRLQVAPDVHLSVKSERMPAGVEIMNIVATLPGHDPQARERILVVSGHYDSRNSDNWDAQGDAPGANDDASGTAAVMELACVMAARSFPATLVFMAVAGEEQGLLGADFWAARAKRLGLNIEAMVTNDIIGSPVGDTGQRDARQVRTGGAADFGAYQLGRYVKETGERYLSGFSGYRVRWRDTGSMTWQGQRDVGRVTRATLVGLSKDNLIFGVQALGREGVASLASYPFPARR